MGSSSTAHHYSQVEQVPEKARSAAMCWRTICSRGSSLTNRHVLQHRNQYLHLDPEQQETCRTKGYVQLIDASEFWQKMQVWAASARSSLPSTSIKSPNSSVPSKKKKRVNRLARSSTMKTSATRPSRSRGPSATKRAMSF